MKFKYLVSDMDGVLLDTERLIFEMYKKSAVYYGFELSEADFIKTIGINTKGTKEILKSLVPIDYDVFYNKREEFFVEHIKQFGAPIKKGVIEGLKSIKKSGILTAMATSTSKERSLYRLQGSEIPDLFDAFVFGDEIEHGKPAPDIFILAAKKLKVAPEECVVLEDSPAGIQSAKNAGMHTVLIPDMKQPDEELVLLADYIASDFSEAVEYVLS